MMCELRHTSLVVQKMQGRDTSACACGHHRSRLPAFNFWDAGGNVSGVPGRRRHWGLV
jgi:hypothetical protein